MSPVFVEVNTAVDKNQLLMNIMELVAPKAWFGRTFPRQSLLGVNGSGKHNN
ncbi:MAG: hypothetical protein IPQ28_12180 [Sphingobacteriales bacterium]|nr:hypothetical protein [Sphingobacteriales bacterium]